MCVSSAIIDWRNADVARGLPSVHYNFFFLSGNRRKIFKIFVQRCKNWGSKVAFCENSAAKLEFWPSVIVSVACCRKIGISCSVRTFLVHVAAILTSSVTLLHKSCYTSGTNQWHRHKYELELSPLFPFPFSPFSYRLFPIFFPLPSFPFSLFPPLLSSPLSLLTGVRRK